MSLVTNQPLDVESKDPFKSDVLGRGENITILSKFILSYHQTMLLCIDALFGQGKTTFLELWQHFLLKNHVPTIYYNAWQVNLVDDVLISLLGEIKSLSENRTVPDKEKSEALFQRLVEKATHLIYQNKSSAPHIQADNVTDDALTENFAFLTDQELLAKIGQYQHAKQSLAEFKHALWEFVSSLSERDNPQPLIFMIDELDKCRPLHAIDVLEKVKLLFGVNNIRFVIAVDKSQLGHAIKTIYGQGFDVKGYLHRFIDFDYLLPKPRKEQSYISQLLHQYDLISHACKNFRYQEIEQPLKELVQAYDLTLREQKIYAYMLNFVLRTRYVKEELEYLVICFLIVLKIKNMPLYLALTEEQIVNVDIIFQHINQKFNQTKNYKMYGSGVLEVAIFGYSRDRYVRDEDILAQLEQYFKQYATPEQKSKEMKQFFLQARIPLNNLSLRDIKQAIELSSDFNLIDTN